MAPRSTPSPKGSVYPQNDVATYRDLLLFEERLKTTAASLQRRKSRYQLFLVQLLLVIAFLLLEVLLPPDISLLAIPCKLVLHRVLPDIYTEDTEFRVHPYVSTGLLFVSITTLALFFASGTYADKIAYANKYVPHANRALRSFNMYLNVRKPPLFQSKIPLSPLAFFFPRPAPVESPPAQPSLSSYPRKPPIGATSTSVPIPPMPPTTNPRGELRLSSRVDRAFRDGYERYRATFERKRAAAQQQRARGWWAWWRPAPALVPAGTSAERAGSRGGTPPVGVQLGKEREKSGKGKERERGGLRPSIAERRSTPPLPSLRAVSLGRPSDRHSEAGDTMRSCSLGRALARAQCSGIRRARVRR
ncbi:hypothetical protein DFH07DRAFT_902509 [Mycena maculata]|uniref:Transmembrane protein 188 n=1 Tax=Mycena maculata TaxID=230809 RepID=A0AAD7JSJ6_9AGAR|nr:hypothetical protein DFH07DRAFT_902509 [Mycena maculata]